MAVQSDNPGSRANAARRCGSAALRELLRRVVDGYAFHSSPAAFERDRLRDAEIEDDDYRVRRVTWRQLTEDPGGVERRLRRALARW